MEGSGGDKAGKAVVLRVDADHCAETAAKREYARLAEEYLRGSGRLGEGEYEYRLDLLREFLERTDFPALRRECEGLLHRCGVLSVRVFRGERGEVACRLQPGE